MSPDIFVDTKATKRTCWLNVQSLGRLDWWVKCLKVEGIYFWLDLYVQRALLKHDDIFDFDEIRRGKDQADLKGCNYVNPTIQSAMWRFNEANLTHRFGNALLPDKGVPSTTASTPPRQAPSLTQMPRQKTKSDAYGSRSL